MVDVISTFAGDSFLKTTGIDEDGRDRNIFLRYDRDIFLPTKPKYYGGRSPYSRNQRSHLQAYE